VPGTHVKIYTRTGDKGETSLFGGRRVPKDAPRIEAYGTVDELNAVLGTALANTRNPELKKILRGIQRKLFDVGADLATPGKRGEGRIHRIDAGDVIDLEKTIDRLEGKLKPLRAFILPGGSPAAAHLHHARTVCRRAERLVVRASRSEEIGTWVVVFLNRLSDLLFVLARSANRMARVPEATWKT
jgi:cob(I)alamin adenosyltransferase